MIAASLVTVRIAESRKQLDMELPTDMPAGELAPKLLAALKNVEDARLHDVTQIRIKVDARYLDGAETLSSAHIWDGGIITVERSV